VLELALEITIVAEVARTFGGITDAETLWEFRYDEIGQ